MKCSEIIDAAIESAGDSLVIELPNGDRISTKDYRYDHNKRGEPILVIIAGREIKSK